MQMVSFGATTSLHVRSADLSLTRSWHHQGSEWTQDRPSGSGHEHCHFETLISPPSSTSSLCPSQLDPAYHTASLQNSGCRPFLAPASTPLPISSGQPRHATRMAGCPKPHISQAPPSRFAPAAASTHGYCTPAPEHDFQAGDHLYGGHSRPLQQPVLRAFTSGHVPTPSEWPQRPLCSERSKRMICLVPPTGNAPLEGQQPKRQCTTGNVQARYGTAAADQTSPVRAGGLLRASAAHTTDPLSAESSADWSDVGLSLPVRRQPAAQAAPSARLDIYTPRLHRLPAATTAQAARFYQLPTAPTAAVLEHVRTLARPLGESSARMLPLPPHRSSLTTTAPSQMMSSCYIPNNQPLPASVRRPDPSGTSRYLASLHGKAGRLQAPGLQGATQRAGYAPCPPACHGRDVPARQHRAAGFVHACGAADPLRALCNLHASDALPIQGVQSTWEVTAECRRRLSRDRGLSLTRHGNAFNR